MTPLPSRSEIEEAVEIVIKGRHEVTWTEEIAKEYRKATDILLSLASAYLGIAGKCLGKKK